MVLTVEIKISLVEDYRKTLERDETEVLLEFCDKSMFYFTKQNLCYLCFSYLKVEYHCYTLANYTEALFSFSWKCLYSNEIALLLNVIL